MFKQQTGAGAMTLQALRVNLGHCQQGSSQKLIPILLITQRITNVQPLQYVGFALFLSIALRPELAPIAVSSTLAQIPNTIQSLPNNRVKGALQKHWTAPPLYGSMGV